MRQTLRHGALRSVVLALAAADAGARVLAPPRPSIDPAPVDVRSYFSAEEIERGRRFARPQRALALARGAVQVAALAAAAKWMPRVWRGRASSPWVDGTLGASALAVGLTVPSLPLAAVARRRAKSVGLITQSWGGWAVDLVKATAIEAVIAGAVGGTVVALMRRFPRRWWIPAAGGSVGFGALLTALAPVILDPVFNDFTPLPEGDLRRDVLELARAAGVRVGEVYSVDASRRTTAANAYVTGLGPTKRVVLFDTLLDRYDRDEVRVVVAHELAHVHHRDVPRSVAYAAIVAPAAAFAVQRLSWTLSFERDSAAALPTLALAAGLVGAPTGLIGNRLSRAVERRADAFALELSGAAQAFVGFERKIALQNVADLEPPRWVTSLMSTHPSTAERIGFAVAYAKQAGVSPPYSESSS